MPTLLIAVITAATDEATANIKEDMEVSQWGGCGCGVGVGVVWVGVGWCGVVWCGVRRHR